VLRARAALSHGWRSPRLAPGSDHLHTETIGRSRYPMSLAYPSTRRTPGRDPAAINVDKAEFTGFFIAAQRASTHWYSAVSTGNSCLAERVGRWLPWTLALARESNSKKPGFVRGPAPCSRALLIPQQRAPAIRRNYTVMPRRQDSEIADSCLVRQRVRICRRSCPLRVADARKSRGFDA